MVRRKSVKRAKTRATGNKFLNGDPGLHHGPTPSYSPFSTADAQKLIEAAFDTMSQTGVGFEPVPGLMDKLADAGCDLSQEDLIKFPVELIQKSLDSVARSVRLWDRDGSASIKVDNQHSWFVSGMTCIKVYDRETGDARDSNREDLATMTLVSDALENIDAVCVTCKNVEESDIHGEIDEFCVLAENTTKPLLYLCEHTESLNVAIDMAATIRGSHQALADKPYFLQVVTPLPLYYAKSHTEQLVKAVEAGVPVTVGTVTIGGASAPITIAGCIVHSLVTDLTAIVLSQIVCEGSFCIGSSDASFMEVATGGVGAPSQSTIAEMAMCEISRILGLPRLTSTAGDSSAQCFNQDAVCDISSNMMQAFYTRPAISPYMGSLDQGITFSLHALLLADELVGQLRSMWRGIEINDEMMALELTQTEGPRGNYLANEHTASYCRRESWDSRYFGANYPVSASGFEADDLVKRIDRELQDILQNHQPVPLALETLDKIHAIAHQFRQDSA